MVNPNCYFLEIVQWIGEVVWRKSLMNQSLFAESRLSSCVSHHKLCEGTRNWLYKTLHEFGDQYFIQKAREEEPKPLVLPLTTFLRHLDLHGGRLLGGQFHALHSGPLQSLWVVQPSPLQCQLSSGGEPIHSAQQPLVHHWVSHAARQVFSLNHSLTYLLFHLSSFSFLSQLTSFTIIRLHLPSMTIIPPIV